MQSKQQIQLNEKDSLQDMLNLEKEIVKLYSTALTEGNGSKFRHDGEKSPGGLRKRPV